MLFCDTVLWIIYITWSPMRVSRALLWGKQINPTLWPQCSPLNKQIMWPKKSITINTGIQFKLVAKDTLGFLLNMGLFKILGNMAANLQDSLFLGYYHMYKLQIDQAHWWLAVTVAPPPPQWSALAPFHFLFPAVISTAFTCLPAAVRWPTVPVTCHLPRTRHSPDNRSPRHPMRQPRCSRDHCRRCTTKGWQNGRECFETVLTDTDE